MKETPVYVAFSKKNNNIKYYRNFWCVHYDLCLGTAARKDLYLDCSHCLFKENVIDDLSVFINRKRKPND